MAESFSGRRSSSIIQLGGSEGKVVTSDPILKTLPIIGAAHHEIHEGDYFGCGHIWDSVDDDGVAELIVIVGANYALHATPSGNIGGDAYAHLFEAPTFADAPTDYGTAVTVEDFNRVTDNTAGITVYHTPTIATDGTQLDAQYVPGGSGPAQFKVGGGASTRIEHIFAKSTIYLLRLTNKSGGAVPASIAIEGYEHS
jgi:hypothetical protein